ncbi:sporulation protein YunB [Oscillospiraceae bacterium OttesenSCG-928-G22]|nr:sporulation protein YunB [Oscillospiraceae bacterium OttesenSCG-928-G22]
MRMMFLRRRFLLRRRPRGGGRRRGALVPVFLCIAALLSIVFLFNGKVAPALEQLAVMRIYNIGSRTINSAIAAQLEELGVSYDTLVSLEKDSEGKITALKTNMIEVNRLKSRLMNSVIDEISALETSTLGIPLGNLTGIELLSGRGPDIPVKIVPLGTADTRYINHFSTAGINQTRHQIIMEVSVGMSVLLPGYETETTVMSQVTIAETVIVGSVPEAYTYLEDSNRGVIDLENEPLNR